MRSSSVLFDISTWKAVWGAGISVMYRGAEEHTAILMYPFVDSVPGCWRDDGRGGTIDTNGRIRLCRGRRTDADVSLDGTVFLVISCDDGGLALEMGLYKSRCVVGSKARNRRMGMTKDGSRGMLYYTSSRTYHLYNTLMRDSCP